MTVQILGFVTILRKVPPLNNCITTNIRCDNADNIRYYMKSITEDILLEGKREREEKVE